MTALKQEKMHLNKQLEQVAASAAADKKFAVELLEDKDNDLQDLRDLVIAQTEHLDNTLTAQNFDQAERLGKKDGCLRTAEAFIAALEGRLQESAGLESCIQKFAAQELAFEQMLRANCQKIVADQQTIGDLQTALATLQRASDFAHYVHNLEVRKLTRVACYLVLSSYHQQRWRIACFTWHCDTDVLSMQSPMPSLVKLEVSHVSCEEQIYAYSASCKPPCGLPTV